MTRVAISRTWLSRVGCISGVQGWAVIFTAVVSVGCGKDAPGVGGGSGDGGDTGTSFQRGDSSTGLEGGDGFTGDVDGGDSHGGAHGDGGSAVITCTTCHGTGFDPAPPNDVAGNHDTSLPTVGAHRTHGRVSQFYRRVLCEDCHRVPQEVTDPGHIDTAPAELVWGAVPRASGSTATYANGTCAIYCHGETLDAGGTNTLPTWTKVGQGEAVCGACHAIPPPAPHPALATYECAPCHPSVGMAPLDPETHVDGKLDLVLSCWACHGSETDGPAPPRDLDGNTATTHVGVGAHASHLGSSDWHAPVTCADCHLVPGSSSDAGHIDGDGTAEVNFGGAGSADGVSTSWDRTTGECVTYCHGATQIGGANTTPTWTAVGTGEAACGACHGLPPTPHMAYGITDVCEVCHGTVVDADRNIIAPDLHINGMVDSSVACGDCHGLPPATGAHLAHVFGGPASPIYGGLRTASGPADTGYGLGCGHCHPRQSDRHLNGGFAEVEIYDPTAPGSSLKGKHPSTARYVPGATTLTDSFGRDYTEGTCSDVYCHSGLVTKGAQVAQPGVDFLFNGYPIEYDPRVSTTRTRNFIDVGWGDGAIGCADCHGYAPQGLSPALNDAAGESHSFVDGSGAESLHQWNHGAAPVPCRTCHARTVADVPDYMRTSAGVAFVGPAEILDFSRHVSGAVDVSFDTQLPVSYGTAAGDTVLTLEAAAYDSATRTCSNIACHKRQTAVTFGSPYREGNTEECNSCHQF